MQGCHPIHSAGAELLNKRLMDKETRKLILAIILISGGIIIALSIGWYAQWKSCYGGHDTQPVKHDTAYVTLWDTIHDTLPPIVKTRYIHDTTFVTKDSMGNEHDVLLPITQNYYRKEGFYEAWVSGIYPSLDSVNVVRQKEVMTITETKREIQREWKLYAQGGFFARDGIFLPSVGISIASPKKWSLGANISIPHKGSPEYNITIGYNILPNKQ